MRRALADLLPKPVLQRTTKAGLGRCFSIALENHWDAVEEISEAPLVSQLGYIQAEQLRRSLASLRKGEHPTFVLRLLKVLALELWLRDVSARGLLSLPGTGLRMGEWPDSDRVCDPATLLIATAGRKVVGIS